MAAGPHLFTAHTKTHSIMSDSNERNYERLPQESSGDWYERLRTEREMLDEHFREAKRALKARSKKERLEEEAKMEPEEAPDALPEDL